MKNVSSIPTDRLLAGFMVFQRRSRERPESVERRHLRAGNPIPTFDLDACYKELYRFIEGTLGANGSNAIWRKASLLISVSKVLGPEDSFGRNHQ